MQLGSFESYLIDMGVHKAILFDDPVFLNTETDYSFSDFYEIKERSSIFESFYASWMYGAVQIQIGVQGYKYERRVYTVFHVLQEIGGLTGSAFSIAGLSLIVYQIVSQKLFFVSDCFKILLEEKSRPPLSEFNQRITDEKIKDFEPFLKTRRFTSSLWFAILGNLPFRCGQCRRRMLQDEQYYRRGLAKVQTSLDVVTLIRTQKRLKVLEKILFNSKQVVLSRLSRWNYLSQNTSTSSGEEYP